MPEEVSPTSRYYLFKKNFSFANKPFYVLTRQYLPCFDQFAWLDCWNHVTGKGRRVASYCSVSSPPETIVLGNISQKSSDISGFKVSRVFFEIYTAFSLCF
jgi:hypothetical protein